MLSPTQSITGFGTYTQTGGTLVLQRDAKHGAGHLPRPLSAGTINLRGGSLELVPVASSLFALRGTTHDGFQERHRGGPTALRQLRKRHIHRSRFLARTLSPDAATPNALDATLALSPSGLAASAQDLTQSLRLGLDAPQVLEPSRAGPPRRERRRARRGGVGGRGLRQRECDADRPSPISGCAAPISSAAPRGTGAAPGLWREPRSALDRRRRLALRSRHRRGSRCDLCGARPRASRTARARM